MMKWIQGLCKKLKRQQVSDDIRKASPCYPGFNISKQAYQQVTQWQGKDMWNLGHCISAVFASALQDLDTSQQRPFKWKLYCVCLLIDFSLMAQYYSHTPGTQEYMETYLQIFHRTKDIFLEFCTTKAIPAQAEHQDRELSERIVNTVRNASAAGSAPNRRQRMGEAHIKWPNQWVELIQWENYFNFIKNKSNRGRVGRRTL